MMKKYIHTPLLSVFLTIMSLSPATINANEPKDSDDVAIQQDEFSYKPMINGTIRAKFEYEPDISSYRFQVRNARVSLKGWVAPIVDYKAEIDLCDRGDIKVLDIYGRVHLKNFMSFTLGQMRVPFSVDATRSPYILYFANRSFVAKQVGSVRDVGFKVAYTPPTIPLNIEAGIFNGSGLTQQKTWHKECSFSGKINYKLGNVKMEVGGQSIIPDSIRINLLDASLSWSYKRWMVEGEYIYKHYTQNSFPDVNAYNFMVNYQIPFKWVFKWLTLGARFDGMNNHSSGIRNNEGKLVVDDYGRKRLTLGTTFSFVKKFEADIRFNYEKYFYDKGAIVAESDNDKFVIELMVHF